MERNQQIFVGAVIIIALIVIFCLYNKGWNNKEEYVAAGAIDNVGSLLDDQYNLVQAPDSEVPAYNFADLVDDGDHIAPCDAGPPMSSDKNLRPMERLHRIQGQSLMPRISKNATPYNIDVANPTSMSYMVNAPRVQLKSRFKDYSLSSFIRGDVPIQYFPNVPLISTSSINSRDNLRLDGLYSESGLNLYRKYTGKAYKNAPIKIAGAGVAGCGNGGAQGEIVMDNY